MLALKTFEAGKCEVLNQVQINQIATKEVLAIIEQVSDPKFVNLSAQKAEIVHLQEKSLSQALTSKNSISSQELNLR